MLGFTLRTVVCKFEYVSDYSVCLPGHRVLGTICVWIQCIYGKICNLGKVVLMQLSGDHTLRKCVSNGSASK